MGEGIILFTLWYIAIAYNYYIGALPAPITDAPAAAASPPAPPPEPPKPA